MSVNEQNNTQSASNDASLMLVTRPPLPLSTTAVVARPLAAPPTTKVVAKPLAAPPTKVVARPLAMVP